MIKNLILRAETKLGERRTALTPEAVVELRTSGVDVKVERSELRIFPDDRYCESGATLVPPGTWHNSGQNTLVLGLKELPALPEYAVLAQHHSYFAHCYRGQLEAMPLLNRFRAGGGRLYDLEYLTDESGRRVAAFGYWAGFVGAALALRCWCAPELGPLAPAESADILVEQVSQCLRGRQPSVGVTGHLGRAGQGALALLKRLGLSAIGWDLADIPRSGPLLKALEVEVLVHCAGSLEPRDSFLNAGDLSKPTRQLKVLADVTCDQESSLHLFPFYHKVTTLERPVHRWHDEMGVAEPLDIIAIDHLPTLLPRESSEEFSAALLPHLRDYFRREDEAESLPVPFLHSFAKFSEALRSLPGAL
jgi:saccharopine dehydrogenase (NAD+, L-lysine-forming)